MSETATYIRKLTIENVRCFGSGEQSLNLVQPDGRPHQWTVILGENGTGKTTLLECIVNFLEFDNDQRRGSGFLFDWQASIDQRSPAAILRVGNLKKARLTLHVETGDPLSVKNSGSISRISLSTQHSLGHFLKPELEPADFFDYHLSLTCAYGTARRMGKTTLVEEREDLLSSIASLFDPTFELPNAEEWLLQLDYARNVQSEIQSLLSSRFNLVKDMLIRILPDISDIRITKPSKEATRPRVEFKTFDGWLPISWIGYGYRTLVAWIVDLASRMVACYPESKDPLAEPAIVLVDEIDLHLHPKWQRELMGYLSERFPNTQFIVTAHSPIFVQAAENANLVVLRRDKEKGHVVIENDPVEIRGWRLDQILTSDLFGLPSARSPEVERLQEERVKLLSQPKLSKQDEKRVAELEAEMGGLPGGETASEVKTHQLLDRVLQSLQQIPNINQPGAGEAT